MPVVTHLPTSSDSQREALKYHRLLLAIERVSAEVRQMEERGRPDLEDVLGRLLPDLAFALNAESAFVAQVHADTKRRWLELTATHPDQRLQGNELPWSPLIQRLIEDGRPKVFDPLGEDSTQCYHWFGSFPRSSGNSGLHSQWRIDADRGRLQPAGCRDRTIFGA